MSAELKPCPFCGGEAEPINASPFDGWHCRCKRCDIEGNEWLDEATAIRAWNRRATPAPGAPGQEAAAVQAVGAKAPVWYMRDNHTFRPLRGGPEEMVAQCLEEFDAGYTCGMLCSKELSITVHAHGKARRAEFAAAALSALLTAALPPSGAGEKTS